MTHKIEIDQLKAADHAITHHRRRSNPKEKPAVPVDLETADALQPRKCDDCGQVDAYQPITFAGRDLTAGLPFHCQECAALAEQEEQNKAATLAALERRATWEATIPAEYRATDIQHPGFALAAWETFRSHPYQTRNLGLVGSPGRCKTRILALLAKRAINAGLTVAWGNTFDLEDTAARLRNHRHYDEASRTLRHYRTARLLFLDDLGKSRWTPSLESILFQILEARYSAGLVTHWSLNPQPDDADADITTDLLADALDPEGHAAKRNHFAPILSRLQSNTLIVPV